VRRRAFLATGASALAATASRAQARLPRVAFFNVQAATTLDPRMLGQFKAGMAENMLIEGRTVIVEYHWADGSAEKLHALAQALGARTGDLDVIVTAGSQPARELLATGTKIPIVLAVIGDPVRAGFVKTLARPGGAITGLSMANSELEGKRLDVLRAAVPSVGKVMVLLDPSMEGEGVDVVEGNARSLGVELLMAPAANAEQLAPAFDAAVSRGANGLLTMASPFLNFQRERIIALANRHRLPSMFEFDTFALAGGLMSYGPSPADMYRRSASFVAKILKGANPGDLPVEQPTRFELVVNMRTARQLGLTFPQSFLARADEVIE
jgi:putative ABC transport system substrate-binding protein